MTRASSPSSRSIPAPGLRAMRLPASTPPVWPAPQKMPFSPLSVMTLAVTRLPDPPNTPIPATSLWLVRLRVTRLPEESSMATPDRPLNEASLRSIRLSSEPSSSRIARPMSGSPERVATRRVRWLSLAPVRWSAWSNSRIVPPLTVTCRRPARRTPVSSPPMTASPSIVWPARSSVMWSAPMTIPSAGQFVRSCRSVTLRVIVAPHAGSCASAAGAASPAAASSPPSTASPSEIRAMPAPSDDGE